MLDTNAVVNAVPNLQEKLEYLQQQFNTPDLPSTLDRSLEIANYVAQCIIDPNTKLLVKQGDQVNEITGITAA